MVILSNEVPRKIFLKLASGRLSRIDAVSGNRSKFMRDAIDAALGLPVGDDGAEVPVVSEGPKVRVARRGADLLPDAAVLHEHLRKKPMSPRDAEKQLAWMPGRVQRAEMALSDAGLISYQSGLMVPVDE